MSLRDPPWRQPCFYAIGQGVLETLGDWFWVPVLGWIRSSPPRKWPHPRRCPLDHLSEADTPSSQNWELDQSGTPRGCHSAGGQGALGIRGDTCL